MPSSCTQLATSEHSECDAERLQLLGVFRAASSVITVVVMVVIAVVGVAALP
jgi:flagellin-like protein